MALTPKYACVFACMLWQSLDENIKLDQIGLIKWIFTINVQYSSWVLLDGVCFSAICVSEPEMLSLVKACLISLWSVPHPLPTGCSLCCSVDTEQKLSVKDRHRCRYRGRFAWQHSGRHRLRLTQDRNYGRHNLGSLLVNYAEGKLLHLFPLTRHGCIIGSREFIVNVLKPMHVRVSCWEFLVH